MSLWKAAGDLKPGLATEVNRIALFSGRYVIEVVCVEVLKKIFFS